MKPASFILHITPVYRDDDRDGMRRLRAALKCLLRSYGLRCTKLESKNADDEVSNTREREIR